MKKDSHVGDKEMKILYLSSVDERYLHGPRFLNWNKGKVSGRWLVSVTESE